MITNHYLGYLFPATIVNGTVNTVQTITPTDSSTGTGRSNHLFCPALSTLNIYVSATASVDVISNPFNDIAKDKILTTVTATGVYTIAAASMVSINITANTGTVSAVVVYNSELD